ncbi:MAG: hypothetical protein D6694_09105 [Gammaproteobacteria bacterium]|nr:MAG: hypothetical protein D6694_09105 [Gammaproteobacteria bacterium]
MKLQHHIPSQVVDSGVEKTRYSAIENYLQFQFPLAFQMRGRSVGALVLSKGAKGEYFKIVFGFDCQGIHSTLRASEPKEVFEKIESGLKDIPEGETMTIHMESFSSDRDRQDELSRLYSLADRPQLKFLMLGERQRVRELTKQGARKPKSLRIYVTYTVEPSAVGSADQIEKLLGVTQSLWNKWTGQEAEEQQLRFEQLFFSAFTDGFQIWEQLLTNKMGLQVRPLTEVDLWEGVWKRFNQSAPPELPQLVKMTDEGISEEIRSDLHPTSLLIESQRDCPVADRAWVRVKGKYVGLMTFMDKPSGWSSYNSQLRYLWELLSRDQVFDTEIFCELSKANEALVRTAMQRVAKENILASDFASSKQSVDVAASIKAKKTIAAQEQLYEGAVPLNVGVAIAIHRSTPADLDEACRYLQSCIRRPAWIDRETEYAWQIWLQTLPITWDQILSKPFNRRMVYLSSEAPGFMSLVRPRQCDRSGFELLSEEGGVPIYLDLFKQHRNLGIFATTRAGKSVLVSGVLTQALAHQMPIVALDFPKPDGTSTFTDYTRFMGKMGAYFDIGTENNNLFEIPDLRQLPLDQQQERMQDYLSFLEGALMTMVIGGSAESQMFRNTVRSLIVILLEQFFNHPVIMERYDRAIRGGFGSPEWQEMPTLKDFLPFCELSRLELTEMSDDVVKAMGQVKLQLKFWITSRVGKAISAPSSFPTDARLLVFALRNLSDDSDAAILALSAYSAALRRALSSPASIFFIDEAPILFQFNEIAALVAKLCANGAKAGVRVIISGQDPDTIYQSPSASRIVQNLTTRLVGRIQTSAIPSFVKYMGYPEEVVRRNASEAFFPKASGVYSQWLLDTEGHYTYCRYYPSFYQLAAVANNPHEQIARDAYMKAHKDPYQGLSEFAGALVQSLRDGTPIQIPKTAALGGKVAASV